MNSFNSGERTKSVAFKIPFNRCPVKNESTPSNAPRHSNNNSTNMI